MDLLYQSFGIFSLYVVFLYLTCKLLDRLDSWDHGRG